MRTCYCILAVLTLTILTGTATAQTVKGPGVSNVITINPLKFFLFYNLSYYHAISNTVTIGGGGQIPTIKGLNGFGINAEVRLHPSGRSPYGFYIAPNVSYNHLIADNVAVNAVSVGGLLGWQWFPGDEFALGLGIGVDYYFLGGSTDSDKLDTFNSYEGTVPALRFDIGYAW